ncbi:MAG: DoxX family protein [Bacteroidota bacterium]|nr:DoxX family protein [Bacteroidota bacterium]
MRDETIYIERIPTKVIEEETPHRYRPSKSMLDTGLLILRLALGGLMLLHGIGKIRNGVEMFKPSLAEMGLPEFLIYGLYIAEVLAPVMIIFGLWTRFAALTIVIDMIMAIVLVRKQDFFALSHSGGWAVELEALYFFMALVLCFTGSGAYRITRSPRPWD